MTTQYPDTDQRPTILNRFPAFDAEFEKAGFRVVGWPASPGEQAAFLAEEAPRLRAAVTTGGVGLPDELMGAASSLALICCLGAGYEAFDPTALAARGVALVNGGQLNAEDVADLAIGLFIAVQRRIVVSDRLIREGRWTTSTTHRIRGLNCGILGLGGIGRAVAERATVFGMNIAWHGPRAKPGESLAFEPDALALAAWSDVLFVCCPLTPRTAGLVDAAMLEALGPGGVLVNIGRGPVVDEPALVEALRAGRIAGAGLDVFMEEPTDPALWAGLDNVVLHPHAGGATFESLDDVLALAVDNLRRFFAGQPLLTEVN